MKIIVEVKNVYGNTLIYPVCDIAKSFANIAKQKTLNDALPIIKKMGYEVAVKTPELSL